MSITDPCKHNANIDAPSRPAIPSPPRCTTSLRHDAGHLVQARAGRGYLNLAQLLCFGLASLWLGACSSTDFETNCEGETVTNCLPYEASMIQSAMVTPEAPTLEDTSVMVRFQLAMNICPRAPRPHEVTVRMRIGDGDEGQLIDIITLRDDGRTEGDETAQDGLIDVEVVNPFLNRAIPANEDVFLRFVARSPQDCSSGMCFGGTCRSEGFEIPFRTGSRPERNP